MGFKFLEALLGSTGSFTTGQGYGVKDSQGLPIALGLMIPDTDPTPEGYRDISDNIDYLNRFAEQETKVDYLFVSDRIIDAVEAKVDAYAPSVYNESSEITNATEGLLIQVSSNPLNDFTDHADEYAIYLNGNWEFRDKLNAGYELCSTEERTILAQRYLGSPALFFRDNADSNTVFDWIDIHHELAIEARTKRIRRAAVMLDSEIPVEAPTVLATITNYGGNNLYELYKEFGLRSQVTIVHYICSLYVFTGVGLKDVVATPASGITIAELADKIYNLVAKGIN